MPLHVSVSANFIITVSYFIIVFFFVYSHLIKRPSFGNVVLLLDAMCIHCSNSTQKHYDSINETRINKIRQKALRCVLLVDRLIIHHL